MEKQCSVCLLVKPINEFHSYKLQNGVGYRHNCKSCIKEYKKELYRTNKEEILSKQKVYRELNYDKVRATDKNYKKRNRKILSNKQKEYVKKNRKKINKYKTNYEKKRKSVDPIFKLSRSIMNLIRVSFKRKGLKKSNKTNIILGCTYQGFKSYLEAKWKPWMNWENYGLYNGQPDYGWDLDHIIPLKTATAEADIIKLCHYTNLQPLCSYINRDIKRDLQSNLI